MKGKDTERAQTVVGDDLRLRIYPADRVALMVMGDGEKLGRQDQYGGERGGCPPASFRPSDT